MHIFSRRVQKSAKYSPKTNVELSQGCMTLPWLLNISMDGRMRKMNAKVGNVGTKLKINGQEWEVVACLFAEREEDEFHRVCMRRKLKLSAKRS